MQIQIPYKPRKWQQDAAQNLNRFSTVVVHRRGGKTVWIVNKIIYEVLKCTKSRPQAAYIAPSYRQARKIAWDYFKEFLAPLVSKNLVKFHETDLRIDFVNGAKIYLLGAEDPDSIRGLYFDYVALDEYAQMPVDFFEKVIRPTLSDRIGGAVLMGTPSGKNHFYDVYLRGLDPDNKDWSSILLKWQDTNALNSEEIDAAWDRDWETS